MSSRIGVVPTRRVATTIALAVVCCLLGTFAAAQVTIQPKDELYAGYSWLHPGGSYTVNGKTQDVTDGVDISNVYYLPFAHNLGVLIDASGHWGSSYNVDGFIGHATDYYGLGGLQYKYHSDSFSPFFRVYAGALHQIPPFGRTGAASGMRLWVQAAVSIISSGTSRKGPQSLPSCSAS